MAEAQPKGGKEAWVDDEVVLDDTLWTVNANMETLDAMRKEAAKRANVPEEKCSVQVGSLLWLAPNKLRPVSDEDSKVGIFFMTYGLYVVRDCIPGEKYKLQRVAQKRGDSIVELGPSAGTITSGHLKTIPLFEAVLDRVAKTRTTVPEKGQPAKPAGAIACLQRSSAMSMIFGYLLPRPDMGGVFSFEFDAGILALGATCRALDRSVSMHPLWLTGVLGLSHRHVGAVLAHTELTCASVARYICLNAARLPDVIRRDPEFRNILRPGTRHKIEKKQARDPQADATPELPPKMRAVQLLGTFLLGEPAYRGDADNDPITAELFALCQKIAKEDPLFVLKMAHYVRNTLTFRNTTNFLLASATKIEPCRPYVRSALPVCTNLPTDLLELWDFWRKLSGSISLPSCLKKGFADKFLEFNEYQLGKYLNAKVPKSTQVAPAVKGKGKGKGKALDQKDPGDAKKAAEEALAKRNSPLTRPLTLKTLIRTLHTPGKTHELVCGVLRKQYPFSEEEFKLMELDCEGTKAFDPERAGEKFRVAIPKTWETELSEKGNTKEVWQELVAAKSLPFMAMLRNLRNILMAGVDEKTHKTLLGRLKSQQQVAGSKQMPIRFLSAFEAIDFDDATLARLVEEAKLEQDFVEEEKTVGSGKEAKKIMKKRLICRNPPTRELLDQYRNALETAVSLAARNNVPPLVCPTGGKAVVLVDVSGSMLSPLTQGPKKCHESAMQPHRRSSGRPIVEGQEMDLEDYFSQAGQRHSKKISVSMTWIGQDLDLSVMVLDKDGKQVVSVSYSNTEWSQIWHSGDITNAPHGAEEVISVDLENLPETAYMLMFTVNSYSGQPFDDLPEAAISLRDDGLEGDSLEATQEICAMRLTGKHKAVIACCLTKKERGWSFRCLNTPQAQGATVQTLLEKIRKEYEAAMADAATSHKRLVDAALLLALCIRERLGDEQCEVVLFSSPGKAGGPGYHVLRSLGPKVLANVRRCHAVADQLGLGTELPIDYLQELAAARVPVDHLILLTDGLVAPAKDPANALSRWLAAYRARVQPLRFACIDVLGLGKPSVSSGSSKDDVLISGYSEATLRYLTQEPGAQLAEIEAVELPAPKQRKPAATDPAEVMAEKSA